MNCLPCHFTATVTSSGIAMSAPRCVSRGGKVRMGDLGPRGNSSNLFSSFAFLEFGTSRWITFWGSAAAPWRRTGRPGGRGIRRGRRVLARVRARPRSSPGPPPDLCRLSHCSRSRSSRLACRRTGFAPGRCRRVCSPLRGAWFVRRACGASGRGFRHRVYAPAAGAGLYFLLLERVTRELNERFPMGKDASSTAVGARTFAVGAASRSLAATLLCPVTVVKTRMEYASMSGAKYAGVTNALWTIGRNEGARGLFSGLGSTLLRDAPFSGLNLVMYTQTRAMMSAAAEAQGREMTPLDTLVAGAIAGGSQRSPRIRRTCFERERSSRVPRPSEDPGGGGDARAVGGIHAENRAANPTASVDVESVRVRREKSGRDVALAVRQRGGAKRRGGSGGGGAGERDRYSVS